MKSLIKNYLMLLLTASCSCAMAQDKKPTKEEQAWLDSMLPGKMHEMLNKSSGVWTEEVTMWMASEATPIKSTMTAMNRMIMGNRYLQGMHRGSVDGKMFEGISVIGYDNAKKSFVSTWIDNMGTGIMVMEGGWKEPNKIIEMTGKQADPLTGKDIKMRELFRFIDDNNQTLEMYSTPLASKEYKSMEIKYTRKPLPPHPPSQEVLTPVPPVKPTENK